MKSRSDKHNNNQNNGSSSDHSDTTPPRNGGSGGSGSDRRRGGDQEDDDDDSIRDRSRSQSPVASRNRERRSGKPKNYLFTIFKDTPLFHSF